MSSSWHQFAPGRWKGPYGFTIERRRRDLYAVVYDRRILHQCNNLSRAIEYVEQVRK